MSDYINPGRDAVTIGRLRKKAAKLAKQRDHWKGEHDKLRDALNSLPIYERAINRWSEVKKREAEWNELRQRCTEQALLIKQLTKDLP